MMGQRMLSLFILAGLCSSAVVFPQQDRRKKEEDQGDVVELKGTLINVPVAVRDANNRYIPNLQQKDFRLYEDGTEQQIAFFSNEEEPFSVALLLDTSGSTQEDLPRIQDAAITFVQQLRSQDQVMVISFDDHVTVECEFTSDRREAARAIRSTRPGRSTHLYDAVFLAVDQRMRRITGRKAMILFTDGVDTASKDSSYEETLYTLEESSVLTYPIWYDTRDAVARRQGGSATGGVILRRLPIPIPWPAPGKNRWPTPQPPPPTSGRFPSPYPGNGDLDLAYRRGQTYLRELADRTGGVYYAANTLYDLPNVFSLIADELRHQYLLGYYPTNSAQDGGFRRIRVTVNRFGASVRARPGYRAIRHG